MGLKRKLILSGDKGRAQQFVRLILSAQVTPKSDQKA